MEYLGEVTVIEVSKTDYKTELEAIPHAPDKWVRDTYLSLLIGVIGGFPAGLTMFFLEGRRQRKKTSHPRRRKET